ncbi:MAG: DUF262 domain-containing protein [Spirochaetaceae bacterium]|nr:DUF262 domain-containing protein [Spirochaetaceae bacterium]
MKNYTFWDIINDNNIRIPKIQRDYAQGRKSPKVNEIRKNFVHSLIKTVKGEYESLELDFVYGSKRNNSFEPLDGQQRLTTLFLLHWILGENLKDDKSNSKFTYETRTTSKDFCSELVKHTPDKYIKKAIKDQDAIEKDDDIKDREKKEKIKNVFSKVITGHDWFQWLWKFDSSIQSMLVMLDSLYQELNFYPNNIDSTTLEVYRKNLRNITFNFLNLNDFNMSDELFVKMNDRGKQLSDFDILKSSLEEEIQIQKKKKILSEKTEENWRSLMDGKWIDFFWQKYASPVLNKKVISNEENDEKFKKEKLEAVEKAENQFKKLLLRLVALQILQKAPVDLADCSEKDLSLIKDCYDNFDEPKDEHKLDNILNSYNDYWLRTDSDKNYRIDFEEIIKTINNFIYEEKEENDNKTIIRDLISLIEVKDALDKDDSYLDLFLNEKVPKDLIAIFYCFVKYINNIPLISDFKNTASEQDMRNLCDWIRIMRNIIKNDNNTNQIDKIQKLIDVIKGIDSIFDDLNDFFTKNQNSAFVINFFAQLTKMYGGLDNSSLKEEINKAKLITGKNGEEWASAIKKAENNYYLWGQIRCILSWSKYNNEYDLEKFKSYECKLTELFDFVKSNNGNANLFYAAIISVSDYWKKNNRMYIFNNNRDYSIKRYLRDEEAGKENGYYGNAIKELVDKWLASENNNKTVEDYFKYIIQVKLKTETSWKKFILLDPSILDDSSWKTIFIKEHNHVFLGKNKTKDSHCFDPCLLFLRKKLEKKGVEPIFNDSLGEPPNYLEFSSENKTYSVKWDSNSGRYEVNGDISKFLNS